MNMKIKKIRKIAGFTLIELLVVISIVGLLSSIILAALKSARDKGSVAAGQQFSGYNYRTLGADAALFWDFNEPGSLTQNAIDKSQYKNDGVLSGSASRVSGTGNTPTATGNSVLLNSPVVANDYVANTSINYPDSLTKYTFSLWVKPGNLSSLQYLIDTRNLVSSRPFWLYYNNGSSNLLGVGGDTCPLVNVPNTTLSQGVWQHIAVSYDQTFGGSKLFNVYINGKFVGQTSIPCTADTTFSKMIVGIYGGNLTSNPFIGNIDDVAVYISALTASEIQRIYAKGLPTHSIAENK